MDGPRRPPPRLLPSPYHRCPRALSDSPPHRRATVSPLLVGRGKQADGERMRLGRVGQVSSYTPLLALPWLHPISFAPLAAPP